MIALVDSDTPVYTAALSAQDDELWVATSRLDRTIDKILTESGCSSYRLFVSGRDNFRKEIDPLYKANRPTEEVKWRKECHQHLIDKWGAEETDGYEADDAVGCEQRYDGSTIICGIDKDLLMIAGLHYQWPIVRGGKVVRPGVCYNVTPEQGIRHFFEQMLKGDAIDNIIGISKIGEKKSKLILSDCRTEDQMYEKVLSYYEEAGREEDFYKNLDLLFIWREYGITYTIGKEI